jgi:tetratricopeptide (TPR) repeat protein
MRRSDMDELEYLLDVNPEEAVALGRRIAEESPDDADAWGWLADAHIEAGNHDDALQALAEYVRRDPDWLEAYTLRAGLLAELGRFDAAAVEVEVARAIDSEAPALLRASALCQDLQGQFEAADDLYRRAAQADPDVPPPARFERRRAEQTIQRVLRDVAKEGLALKAVFAEIPTHAGKSRLLSRPLDLRDAKTVVVYLRNLERELEEGAELEDLAAVFEERLAELVEAN